MFQETSFSLFGFYHSFTVFCLPPFLLFLWLLTDSNIHPSPLCESSSLIPWGCSIIIYQLLNKWHTLNTFYILTFCPLAIYKMCPGQKFSLWLLSLTFLWCPLMNRYFILLHTCLFFLVYTLGPMKPP